MVSMTTEVMQVDPQRASLDVIRGAGDALARGRLVAFPTETVYGVAARADHPEAIARLRELKSREGGKAFTVHIASREDIRNFVDPVPGLVNRFVRKGWPGPLTLIINVPDPLTTPISRNRSDLTVNAIYYDNSVGLRCPDDVIATGMLRAAGGPVVAASANLAGNPPPTTGAEVRRDLDGRIDLLIDAGRTKYAKPSTIVRINAPSYELVREGVLDAGVIERLGTLRILFVCTGNTCRSVMAAALAARLIADRLGCEISDLAKHGIIVRSAGTSGGVGGANRHAITVMQRRGLNVAGHSSTLLTVDMIQQADHVFAMTSAHQERILEMVPSAQDRVARLIESEDLSDPLGGTEDDYARSAGAIEEALRTRLAEMDL